MVSIEEKTTLKFPNGVEITISRYESKVSVLEKLKENSIDFVDENYNILIDYDNDQFLYLCFEHPKPPGKIDLSFYFDRYRFVKKWK